MKIYRTETKEDQFSSPFIEERLYFFIYTTTFFDKGQFSSPFIEERLYFTCYSRKKVNIMVLVPFYRGAVVFGKFSKRSAKSFRVLVPFYRGAVVFS